MARPMTRRPSTAPLLLHHPAAPSMFPRGAISWMGPARNCFLLTIALHCSAQDGAQLNLSWRTTYQTRPMLFTSTVFKALPASKSETAKLLLSLERQHDMDSFLIQ